MIRSRGAEVVLLALAVLASVITCGGGARAQTDPRAEATARALFFEARDLMAGARWSEACPKLEESERLDPGIGTEFNLASCLEHLGHLTAALVLFERVVTESHASGLDEHEGRARARADILARRVPTLTVSVAVGGDVQGLDLTRDGAPLERTRWSVPVRVDPGAHSVEARAAGRKGWSTTISLAESGAGTVEVPVLQVVASLEPPAPSLPAAAPVEVARDEPPARGTRRTIGLVLGGVGLAGIATGAVFGALSLAAHDEAASSCNAVTNGCTTQQGVDARASAVSRGNASTWFLVGGGAVLAAGAIVWFTAPATGPVARMGLAWTPGAPASVTLRAEF